MERDKVLIALQSDTGRVLIDIAEIYDNADGKRTFWRLATKKGNSWFELKLMNEDGSYFIFKLTVKESYYGTDGVDTRCCDLYTAFLIIDTSYQYRGFQRCDVYISEPEAHAFSSITRAIGYTNRMTAELQFDLADYPLRFDEV